MSAISGGPVQKRVLQKLSGPMKVGAVIACGIAMTGVVSADDGKGKLPTKVAAIDSTADAVQYRLGMPVPRIDLSADLRTLLVQYRPSTKNDATADEDTILVALPVSAPKSVDDDIAREHGLELLERTELPELDMRIVQYRASGNRPTGPIIAMLRNDQRIRRAQLNVPYGAPAQGAPNRLNAPADVAAKPEPVKPRVERKGAAVAQAGQRPDPEPRPLPVRADEPLRAGKVGDVLAGGL